MATTKKPVAKKPAEQKSERKVQPGLTREEQRLLATHERRMALKRLQGMA